jgi:glutaconate CoA-transferase subunit A
MSRVTTLADAVAAIPDGSLLTFGGFDLNRAPMALVREIVRQGRRGLHLVSPPNPLPLDLLVGAGAVAGAEFGYLGFQYEHGFVVAPNVRRAIERGTLAWRERDVFEIVQGLRAAATGVPFLPIPGGEGSDYAAIDPPRQAPLEPGGAGVAVTPALRPDVALLHAQEADPDGNLFISDPYADDLLARASRRVIATAERIVARVAHPTVSCVRVHAVVEAGGGAFPTACHGHYAHAADHLKTWVDLAGEGRFAEYLRTFVTAPADHSAQVAAAGGLPAWDAPASGAAGRPSGADAAASDGSTLRDAAPDGSTALRDATSAMPGAADRLVAGMARRIADGDLVVTGLASALPMLAVAVARATHAPNMTYINCIGAVDPRFDAIGPTSVDARLLDRCRGRVILTDLFDLSRQGRIDVMFFGAAQTDAAARMNLTCIGEPARPRVKLPGPAGSTSIRPCVKKVIILAPRHSTRALVERVDFASSVPSSLNRETWVVTDLAILRLEGGRLRVASRHAGVAPDELRAKTGFAIDGRAAATTPEPTREEMAAIVRHDSAGLRHRLI